MDRYASTIYTVFWIALCVSALIVCVRNPDICPMWKSTYRRFLFVQWKWITAFIGGLCLTLMAPYTGDPTWDYIDASFMAVLTFLTAPWAVGVLYRAFRRMSSAPQIFVASCVWLFTASWSYDLYLLIRDGRYPVTWLTNLFASSSLYAFAGLLWNLEWRSSSGLSLAFKYQDWPSTPLPGQFRKVWRIAILIMGFIIVLLAPFVLQPR